jgi:hypothetical protein
MKSRLPRWMLLLYVAIDLSNPFVPGAFGFTPESGLTWVEAMSHARPKLSVGTSETSAPSTATRLLLAEGERPRWPEPVRAADLTAWLVGVRTGDPPARDLPPPSSDDH